MSRIEAATRKSSVQLEVGAWCKDSIEVMPIGLDLTARIAAIDERRMRESRLVRLRVELASRDYAGALLSNPMNIRYATGTRNMATWTMHDPGRYVFVGTDGPVVLFEFSACLHLSEGNAIIDALRKAVPWSYFMAGPRVDEKAGLWATEIIDLMQQCGH